MGFTNLWKMMESVVIPLPKSVLMNYAGVGTDLDLEPVNETEKQCPGHVVCVPVYSRVEVVDLLADNRHRLQTNSE